MFQTFEVTSNPLDGPPRLAALRNQIAAAGLDGFLVPRADKHQGEYVAECDARLGWLTGFTGSAGFCAVLQEVAGVFVDGRYRVQVRAQVDLDAFTPVDWPETQLGEWLKTKLPKGGKVGFDPWLHTKGEIEKLEKSLSGSGVELIFSDNLVDSIWTDRPAPPSAKIVDYPVEFAGVSSVEKRSDIAKLLRDGDQTAVVLTQPESIAWLLNIRGADLPRVPVALAFAILFDDGTVSLFTDPDKVSELTADPAIEVRQWSEFSIALAGLKGVVRVDRTTAPLAISALLSDANIKIAYASDPCLLAKACKNDVEIAGSRAAHLRDGAAMVAFLCWLDKAAPVGGLSEIDVVKKLEGFRRATNALQDISFETISGSGSNGAIVHYRVSDETDRAIVDGDLLLVDSGGQYLDGTTDITRTVPVGTPTVEQIRCFTRVLQGMIAISRVRFPHGVTGGHLDSLARAPLWMAGQDYDHGTGHGVGAYLSVHEGPQRLSRISDVALQVGMILSNEPGYYREGAFGIRIENLIVVQNAGELAGADAREMMAFETLTYVPIDRRLIDTSMLAPGEQCWFNDYHAEVLEKIGPRVTGDELDWLKAATAEL